VTNPTPKRFDILHDESCGWYCFALPTIVRVQIRLPSTRAVNEF
jgi:hypothetical protein